MKRNARVEDFELRVGARAHYEDAAYYTQAYRDRTEDVTFYVEEALGARGALLEYGVGNGRVALPSLRARRAAGVEGAFVGVDLSRAMLTDLRRQLRAEPAEVRREVALRLGDMRAVRLGRRFALVTCPFNAMLHLYERRDFERFFARVREHLAPGGRFVFDVGVPDAEQQAVGPARVHYAPKFRHEGTGQRVRYSERFDHDPARQLMFMAMRFAPLDETSPPWMTPVCQRQLYPLETEALLHYNGFEVRDLYGGFDRSPLRATSHVAVWRCRARRGFSER